MHRNSAHGLVKFFQQRYNLKAPAKFNISGMLFKTNDKYFDINVIWQKYQDEIRLSIKFGIYMCSISDNCKLNKNI